MSGANPDALDPTFIDRQVPPAFRTGKIGEQRAAVARLGAKDWPELIFLTGSICALFLVWWPAYLPMVDAPNHLARLHIMASPTGSPLRQMYAMVWALIPDLGIDLVYASLRGLVSPETTLRICVSLSFLLILSAIGMMQRTLFGRLSYSASAAPIFLFGSSWHVGYVNFLMGSSIALMALAIYIVAGRRLTLVVAVAGGGQG